MAWRDGSARSEAEADGPGQVSRPEAAHANAEAKPDAFFQAEERRFEPLTYVLSARRIRGR